jgi:hypothetical protein
MDTYDMIGSIRLTERIGDKPNANSHITILCYDEDCDEVGFHIKETICKK